MTNMAAEADRSRAAFSLDTTAPGSAARGFEAVRREWETQLGDGFPRPAYSSATVGDFRVRGRAGMVHDVAIIDVHGQSGIRTSGMLDGDDDQVRLFVIRRGAWTLGGERDQSQHTVSAGRFLLRHAGQLSRSEAVPNTSAKILALPAAMIRPLLAGRRVTGPADAAEVRLLVAHTNMVHATLPGLGPAGVRAAHSTLIELAKAVAQGRFDDHEPRLAPALAQAARDLADDRLADPGLSPAVLARELNVSIRTLQRAFAAGDESATAYIRHRRLEEARLALTASATRLSISELAALWHFSDSSHFIRAFKARYGQSPADYARSNPPSGDATR